MIPGKDTALNTVALNVSGEIFHPPVTAALIKGALNTSALNNFLIEYEIKPEAAGASKIYNSFAAGAAGNFNLVDIPFDLWGYGLRRRFNNFSLAGQGLFSQGNLPFLIFGYGKHTVLNNLKITGTGASKNYNNIVSFGHGAFGISFDNYIVFAAGLASLGYEPLICVSPGLYTLSGYDGYSLSGHGNFEFYFSLLADAPGLSRIANDLTRFELFRGVDNEVDFSTPWEIFTEIPHATAALGAGHDYKFVLRKRNDYNLLSQNVKEWMIATSATGEQVVVAPSAPVTTAKASANGKILIESEYSYIQDGENQADQWLIYLTTNGIDPDPETDTPVIQTMAKSDGVARLNYITETLAESTTLKTIVRVRESGLSADSVNMGICSAVATLIGPEEPDGGIFY